ncbi:DUF2732 family protein [uncultured Pluralibacter sp.]|uniref:DUF2732 family protein n=1 Tax=uncultured Pluralibacter sp. TaxID=1490864 RepID=UPI00261C2E0B|nr:DUF2732 family protein [uncultured Pluralibacter sp.]
MIFRPCGDEQLAYMLAETRLAERALLARTFSARLRALAVYINRCQLTGTEAAELLQQEEARLENTCSEVI